MKPLILVSNDAIKCLGVEVFSYLSGEAIILMASNGDTVELFFYLNRQSSI